MPFLLVILFIKLIDVII